jgi:16S rRNA pseudouridine516 synthase
MTLLQALQSQGIGSRKFCLAIIDDGKAFIDGDVCIKSKQKVDPERVTFLFEGELCTWQERIVIMLHKPLGYECSARPQFHPSVLELLPAVYRARGVQPIGRLDVDTSGLLILTDDGQLIHQITHPKRHVSKVYEVTTIDPITPEQLTGLMSEIELNDEPRPVHALEVALLDTHKVKLVIDEGRYHQVRRMLAAVGNRVDKLERTQVGNLRLPTDLAARQWIAIDEAMIGL